MKDAKTYVKYCSSRCLFKRECYGVLSTTCPICAMFNENGKIIITDLILDSVVLHCIVKGTCSNCAVNAYIRRTNQSDYKIHYYSGEISSRDPEELNETSSDRETSIHKEFKLLKEIYRQLVLKYHPDKNSNPNAGEMFIKIQEFYNNRDYDKLYQLLHSTN